MQKMWQTNHFYRTLNKGSNKIIKNKKIKNKKIVFFQKHDFFPTLSSPITSVRGTVKWGEISRPT